MLLTVAYIVLNVLVVVAGFFIMKMNTRITYLEEANGNLLEKYNRTKLILSAVSRNLHHIEKIVDPVKDFEYEYLQSVKKMEPMDYKWTCQSESEVIPPFGEKTNGSFWRYQHDDYLGRK